ncbi:MAG: hypothetical protein ABR568_04755 [Pyrinomonadaceae bacterium]
MPRSASDEVSGNDPGNVGAAGSELADLNLTRRNRYLELVDAQTGNRIWGDLYNISPVWKAAG